jgi:hypothetical protein
VKVDPRQTIARQYFPRDTCRRIDTALDDLAATRNDPIALVAV